MVHSQFLQTREARPPVAMAGKPPMQSLNENGTSLIELLLTAILVASVVVTISLAYPKATASVIANRQRMVATNMANSTAQLIKSQPYSLTDTTDADASIGQFNALCDCRTISDFSVLPSTAVPVEGTTYTITSCIHAVSPGTPSWTSQCSTDPDTGYKNIVVYVSWQNGSQSYSTTQESLLSRT